MKKIGVVGGLGAAATIEYYKNIIEKLRIEDVYPQVVIDSVDMHDVISSIADKNYEKTAKLLLDSIDNLAKAGADFAAISANTPHIVWSLIKDHFSIPVISIIDATVNYTISKGYKNVLIFGTRFTMEEGLYNAALSNNNINYIIPTPQDITQIANIIYPNLENGIIIKEEKVKMIELAEKYIKEYKADSMLLGCTEIPLMIKPNDVSVPIIDTTLVHVDSICELARK